MYICEDIWIEDGPAEEQVKKGASIILNINASPFDLNKINQRKDKVKNKAKKLGVPIVYLNMVGGQDELVFDGAMSHAKIYVNGKYIGERPFGYVGFKFDISHALRKGKNNIAVRLENFKSQSR